MGEIRSTLDIIMEKSRNFVITQEEKKAYKEQEITGKIRGLIQKYRDGALNLERLKIGMAEFEKNDREPSRRIMRKELLEMFELGEEYGPLIEIMEAVAGMDIGPIKSIMKEFEKKLGEKRIEREQSVLEQLRERGISGSAVLPNIEADQEWNDYLIGLRKELRETLGGMATT